MSLPIDVEACAYLAACRALAAPSEVLARAEHREARLWLRGVPAGQLIHEIVSGKLAAVRTRWGHP